MFSQRLCLSLSLTLSPCFSHNHVLSLDSSAVAQRQVVISACGGFFLFFYFVFFLLRHLSPLLTAACIPFLTSLPPPPSSPLFSFTLLLFLSLSFLSFLRTPTPLFLWQSCPPLPTYTPSLAHDLPPLPLLLLSPRLSLRPQDVRRCPVGPEVKPRLSTSHPTRHFDSSISSLCVVCVVLSVGRRA